MGQYIYYIWYPHRPVCIICGRITCEFCVDKFYNDVYGGVTLRSPACVWGRRRQSHRHISSSPLLERFSRERWFVCMCNAWAVRSGPSSGHSLFCTSAAAGDSDGWGKRLLSNWLYVILACILGIGFWGFRRKPPFQLRIIWCVWPRLEEGRGMQRASWFRAGAPTVPCKNPRGLQSDDVRLDKRGRVIMKIPIVRSNFASQS